MKLEYKWAKENRCTVFLPESEAKLEKCSIGKIKRLYKKYGYLYNKYREISQIFKTNDLEFTEEQSQTLLQKRLKYNHLEQLLYIMYIRRIIKENNSWKK